MKSVISWYASLIWFYSSNNEENKRNCKNIFNFHINLNVYWIFGRCDILWLPQINSYLITEGVLLTWVGPKKKFKFSTIVEAAHQMNQNRPKRIWWNTPVQSDVSSVKNPTYWNSSKQVGNNSKTSKDRNRSTLYCTYCKRQNHDRKDCWRASNSCLICGEKHQMKECPKYNPRFVRRESTSDLNE